MFALQLVLQDQRHHYTNNTDDHSAQESIPPNRVGDDQTDTEGLTDDTGQPEQEGIDNQREQAQGQHDQTTSEKLKQRSEQRIDQAKDQRQPNDRCQTATQVDARHDQHRQI